MPDPYFESWIYYELNMFDKCFELLVNMTFVNVLSIKWQKKEKVHTKDCKLREQSE